MNKVMLSGRICSDIELKKASSDTSVCSFRLAAQRKFKNAEGNYDADFISCVAWRSNADFISKYFKKGDPIEVVGKIQTRTFENSDGQKVYVTEVVVDEAGFMLSKRENNVQGGQDANDTTQNFTADGFFPAPDDDLPF